MQFSQALKKIFFLLLFISLISPTPGSLKAFAEEKLNNELLAEPLNEDTALTASTDLNTYTNIVTKSFITVTHDSWEKANTNLLQVKSYWNREIDINPAQAKTIGNYQTLNAALQTYLMGSYHLDKVSPPNHAKARDLYVYSLNLLSSVQPAIIQENPALDVTLSRFISSLKKEIKDINDIIEPR